jgi:lipoyl(octanoyl) transferase
MEAMSAGRETRWSYLGRVPYARALAVQLAVREALRRGAGPERLLLLEHPPTYTLGRNAGEREVVAGADWLRQRGIEIHECDRGGQATYHGPGQLVGYPILDLAPDRRDVRRYVRDLQEVLVRTLAELGVAAAPRPAPEIGVWVGEAKIASLGVHLSRWLTTHGFALNVATDLGMFAGIVPCGMPGISLASVASAGGRATAIEEVARRLVPHFAAVFGRRLRQAPAAEVLAAPDAAPGPAAGELLTEAAPAGG